MATTPVESTRLRVALFGSPDFAVPVLDALHRHHEVRLVVTQPDRPAGRGMALHAPAAARRARALELPLEQPDRLRRNTAFADLLASLELDVAVTAAYGKILPEALLAIPREGFLNVHASLLPSYRGAAPVQWALIDGQRQTGVTIMQTEAGLDTGPIRHQRALEIGPSETAPELFERLSELGVEALLEALELLAHGELPSRPQDDARATLAPLLTKEDGRLDFERAAAASYDRFRGVYAWPGTFFEHGGRSVKVDAMHPADAGGAAGRVVAVDDDGVTVACGRDALRLVTVKPAGKGAMPARAWANGYDVVPGTRLGGEPPPGHGAGDAGAASVTRG